MYEQVIAEATTTRQTVLVVDDAPENILICHKALQSHYEIIMAKSGQECIELARLQQPDLILLDVLMPGMDGFSVLEHMHGEESIAQIPVVLMTSLSDTDSQIRAFDIGAVDFITKPINPILLRHRVSNLLDRESLRRQAVERRAQMRKMLVELNHQKMAMDEHSLVSITDADGNIIYANDNFCRTSGYKNIELVGKNHRVIRSAIHDAAFFANLWSTIRRGQIWKGTIANKRKDGSLYWVQSTIVPRLDEDGHPFQYIAIRTDVTEEIESKAALENARQRESDFGFQIQRRLLFGDAPRDIHGLYVAKFSQASRGMDGDFYTFTRLGDNIFEVLTGDVMGKGFNAALIGAGVKSVYRHILTELLARNPDRQLPSTADLVNAMNQLLSEELMSLDTFVTLSLTRVDLNQMRVSWVNAGHTPSLYASYTEEEISELTSNDMPIGVLSDEVYTEHSRPISIGDTILTFSDGITETFNQLNEQYGLNRVIDLLKDSYNMGLPGSVILNRLRCELNEFSGTHHGTDDRTAIIIQTRPLREAPRGTVDERINTTYFDIPMEVEQVGVIREVIETVATILSPDRRNSLTLATVEAAVNIFKHAETVLEDPVLTLKIEKSDTSLSIELIYPGNEFVRPEEYTPDFTGNSEEGFGLFIIENSVDQVTYGAPYLGIASTRLTMYLTETSCSLP